MLTFRASHPPRLFKLTVKTDTQQTKYPKLLIGNHAQLNRVECAEQCDVFHANKPVSVHKYPSEKFDFCQSKFKKKFSVCEAFLLVLLPIRRTICSTCFSFHRVLWMLSSHYYSENHSKVKFCSIEATIEYCKDESKLIVISFIKLSYQGISTWTRWTVCWLRKYRDKCPFVKCFFIINFSSLYYSWRESNLIWRWHLRTCCAFSPVRKDDIYIYIYICIRAVYIGLPVAWCVLLNSKPVMC